MAIIGIDLGTTNSLVSVWKDGQNVLIPDPVTGDVLTPSVVSIDSDGTLLVGQSAKECLISRPDQTIGKFKRLMGESDKLKIGGKLYAPEELSALVLKKLKRDAELYLGEEVTEAVISVPAYFNDDQRTATKRAGTLAGLHVERLVNEPSAAALACYMIEQKDENIFMVIDFGGGTLDVSLVECFGQVVSVIAVSGNNQLGGIDFDMAIAKHFCIEKGYKFDKLSLVDKSILLKSAEKVKIALTDEEESEMIVNFAGVRETISLSREQLVNVAAVVFEKFLQPIKRVLTDGEVSMEEISDIVMVGGSCKMPVVEMYINHILGKKPVYIGSPDNVVAQGVGIYAGIKERAEGIKEMILTDICPFSLGVGIHNEAGVKDLLSVIIDRNTALPASVEHQYVNMRDNQKEVKFNIYQGEAYYADDNLKLGDLTVPVTPKPKNEEVVNVRFTYDINGILQVWINVPSKGKDTSMVIKGKHNTMSDAEVSRRLEELNKMIIMPCDKEENRTLIEKGQALFQQANGQLKDALGSEIQLFLMALKGNSAVKEKKARERFESVIAAVENQLGNIESLKEMISPDWYQESKATEEKETEDTGSDDFFRDFKNDKGHLS